MIGEQTQCFKNLSAVLEAAGSSIDKIVKVGVFLTTMENFAAMNRAYEAVFKDIEKPVYPLPPSLAFLHLRLRFIPLFFKLVWSLLVLEKIDETFSMKAYTEIYMYMF